MRASVDPGRLRELVTHLVENAAKFSPAEAPIEVQVSTRGGNALIEVLDGGPGIPADRREEAFGRFVRFRPAGYEDVPGAGLGLRISRGLAEAHGGTISVEDGPSGGTMLRVTIPLATGNDETTEDDGRLPSMSNRGSLIRKTSSLEPASASEVMTGGSVSLAWQPARTASSASRTGRVMALSFVARRCAA